MSESQLADYRLFVDTLKAAGFRSEGSFEFLFDNDMTGAPESRMALDDGRVLAVAYFVEAGMIELRVIERGENFVVDLVPNDLAAVVAAIVALPRPAGRIADVLTALSPLCSKAGPHQLTETELMFARMAAEGNE